MLSLVRRKEVSRMSLFLNCSEKRYLETMQILLKDAMQEEN